MDEIFIEEKKYISSKQAAKKTGYAKDYIGQLCREGRVPARLVGRSWYVLESAIQDHRFGNPVVEATKETKDVKNQTPVASSMQSTWESPRYESSSVEILPSVNRLMHQDVQGDTQEEDSKASQQLLEDSWRTWFERFDHIASIEPAATEPKEAEEHSEETEEVHIPIHALYQPAPEEPLEYKVKEYIPVRQEGQPVQLKIRSEGRGVTRTIRIIGVLFATIVAVIAIIGTGYLDAYISGNHASMITGMSVYIK